MRNCSLNAEFQYVFDIDVKPGLGPPHRGGGGAARGGGSKKYHFLIWVLQGATVFMGYKIGTDGCAWVVVIDRHRIYGEFRHIFPF